VYNTAHASLELSKPTVTITYKRLWPRHWFPRGMPPAFLGDLLLYISNNFANALSNRDESYAYTFGRTRENCSFRENRIRNLFHCWSGVSSSGVTDDANGIALAIYIYALRHSYVGLLRRIRSYVHNEEIRRYSYSIKYLDSYFRLFNQVFPVP